VISDTRGVKRRLGGFCGESDTNCLPVGSLHSLKKKKTLVGARGSGEPTGQNVRYHVVSFFKSHTGFSEVWLICLKRARVHKLGGRHRSVMWSDRKTLTGRPWGTRPANDLGGKTFSDFLTSGGRKIRGFYQ